MAVMNLRDVYVPHKLHSPKNALFCCLIAMDRHFDALMFISSPLLKFFIPVCLLEAPRELNCRVLDRLLHTAIFWVCFGEMASSFYIIMIIASVTISLVNSRHVQPNGGSCSGSHIQTPISDSLGLLLPPL